MPNINTLKESRFLKKEDCGPGILVTIRSCEQINVAKEGAPEELKWCLNFEETEKPMVLNSTNAQIIAAIVGSQETDNWSGHKVVLYSDPTITFGGKLIGGIRARAPRNQSVTPASRVMTPPPARMSPQQVAAMPSDEDVPF